MKQIFILVVLILLFSQITVNAAFFSDKLEKYIKDGKETSIILAEEIDDIEFSPLKTTRVYNVYDKSFVDLQEGQYYLFKSERNQIEYYKIQVFATRDRVKADNIYIDLMESGYKEVGVIEEDGMFKIRLGRFDTKDATSKTLDELSELGWSPWNVKVKEQLPYRVYIYDFNGNKIISGSRLVYNGSFRFKKSIYSGTTYFDLNRGMLKVTHVTNLDNLVEGIMQTIYNITNLNLDQDNFSEIFKAYSIYLRTNILYYSLNNDKPMHNPFYRGLAEDDDIINNVRKTSGMILGKEKENGELIINEQSKLKLSLFNNFAISGYDYKNIISKLFTNYKLIDLNEISMKRTVVDAEIEWGLRYKEIRYLSWSGPVVYTVLELDLNHRNLYLEPVLAGGIVPGTGSLENIIKEKSALAGINGGYFSYSGRPLGLIYKKETIISEPVKDRTALLLSDNNKVSFERVSWRGYLESRNKKIKLDGVNRKPGNNQIVLFNRYYGKFAPPIKPGMVELIVADGMIQEINYSNDTVEGNEGSLIPEDGYIVQAHGSGTQELVQLTPGELIAISNDFKPDFEQLKVKMAISAGPLLIKNGKVNITAGEEEFQADIAYGRAPRSAVGKMSDNRLVFFTIDGRQPEYSIGVTLNELAGFMMDYGIIEGMNLDGGGSAQMVVRGITMNSPSEERFISNCLLIRKLH